MARSLRATGLLVEQDDAALVAAEERTMLDVLIKGGTIVDGSGQPARKGDIGIRDGRIAAIGTISEAARETIFQ